jgi:hypothetical protein
MEPCACFRVVIQATLIHEVSVHRTSKRDNMKVLFKPIVIALALALVLPVLANAASRQKMSHHQASARGPATAVTATHSEATSKKQLGRVLMNPAR